MFTVHVCIYVSVRGSSCHVYEGEVACRPCLSQCEHDLVPTVTLRLVCFMCVCGC